MVCDNDKDVKKRLNYNKIVHTLSNRSGSFESGAFPDNSFFEPSSSQNKEWLKIQKYLMLNYSSTDYYLNFALGILEANPDIKDIINSKRETYDVFNLPKRRSKLTGGEFTSNGIYYSKFLKYSYVFPIPEIYTLAYNSENKIEINNGDKTYLKKCKIVKTYGEDKPMSESLLRFNWEDELPLKGVLKYTGQWEEGSRIIIDFVPHSIDIKKMVRAVEDNNNISSFLQKPGLYESYLLARSEQEKLAILYAGLSLQNESWNDYIG